MVVIACVPGNFEARDCWRAPIARLKGFADLGVALEHRGFQELSEEPLTGELWAIEARQEGERNLFFMGGLAVVGEQVRGGRQLRVAGL